MNKSESDKIEKILNAFRTEMTNRMDRLDIRMDKLDNNQQHLGKSLKVEIEKQFAQIFWTLIIWSGAIIISFILAIVVDKIA